MTAVHGFIDSNPTVERELFVAIASARVAAYLERLRMKGDQPQDPARIKAIFEESIEIARAGAERVAASGLYQ